MIWLYLLLLLVPLAAVAYIVWDFRRKTALRAAARAGRLEELVGRASIVRQSVAAGPAAQTTVKSPRAAPVQMRERMLTSAQTLLYYLLRTGLPDYVVLAQVPLSLVVEPKVAHAEGGELARRLAECTIDFVIADKSMRPLTAVILRDSAPTQPNNMHETCADWVRSAGMHHVEFDSTALPRKDAIRTLVLPS